MTSPEHGLEEGEREAQEALLEALENATISFFSPLFDAEYDRLIHLSHPGKSKEQLWREVFDTIADNQTIKKIGLKRILWAYKTVHPGIRQFSPLAREALDYVVANPHLHLIR